MKKTYKIKPFLLCTLLLGLVIPFGATSADTKKSSTKVIWIESDPDAVESSEDLRTENTRELKRRIGRLEKAVRQLQDKVFDLEDARAEESKPKEESMCFLEIPMGKIYTATAATENKARMDVYLRCRNDNTIGSICNKEKIQCKI